MSSVALGGKKRHFQLVLILFVMFMGTSHTCLAELRTWIFGRFFYEPILAGFQDVQIAHIIFEQAQLTSLIRLVWCTSN